MQAIGQGYWAVSASKLAPQHTGSNTLSEDDGRLLFAHWAHRIGPSCDFLTYQIHIWPGKAVCWMAVTGAVAYVA